MVSHSVCVMLQCEWSFRDEGELQRVGRLGARAMGRGYTVGNSAKLLYPAAGASDDWAKGGAGIRFVVFYCILCIVLHCIFKVYNFKLY